MAFLLAHLLRGATLNILYPSATGVISTHAPLARCNGNSQDSRYVFTISTHAPLARCDVVASEPALLMLISTHAPLARCDIRPHY